MEMKYLYRYRDYVTSSYDCISETFGSSYVRVIMDSYLILKRTPKGAWIHLDSWQKKFVNLTARKQFACETPKKARLSFIFRKKRQIKLLKSQLKHAEHALYFMEHSVEYAKDIQTYNNDKPVNIDRMQVIPYTYSTVLDGFEN